MLRESARCLDDVIRDGWIKLPQCPNCSFSLFILAFPLMFFPGAVRVANRPHSQPSGQFTVCPGQQHCPADLREQACADYCGAPHSLPGARHRPLPGEQGGHPFHPGVSQGHRRVPQWHPLHRRDGWKENQPYPAGHNQWRNFYHCWSPVRLWLQDWS